MKRTIFILVLILMTTHTFGQKIPQKYYELVKIADSLYHAKNFIRSANKYSEAFKVNKGKGLAKDQYNSACSWALATVPDSAFLHLEIVTKINYTNYEHIIIDPDLNSLHNDKRWKPILEKIKENKDKAEANLNKPLVTMLDSIYTQDQKYREQLGGIEKQYGWKSKEMNEYWRIINEKDSINLIKIEAILNKYGWLGADVIGNKGNSTLFLVIQHSNPITQQKYLPMMRDAFKKGNAKGQDLALLEDRVALGQSKLQIYGSQIGRDNETQLYYVLPLKDPDNVDKRRAEVGLEPISEYVSNWQIKWNLEQYKKDLPKLEEKTKRQ
jgi:hypothetical protein